MTTLYIHIGTPKTGTTAIQNFLLLNEKQLESNGILHPHIEAEGIGEEFVSFRNARFLAYHSSKNGEEKEKIEDRIYTEGFNIIKKAALKSKKIVITDEVIWLRQNETENFWQKVKRDANAAGCEIKVIVYLRRQDLYIQAVWNQAVKRMTRLDQTFQYFLKKGAKKKNLDYYKSLNEIAEQIGKENVIVRVYEKKMLLQSEGIYRDFLEAIEEPMCREYQIPKEDFNERLDGNYVEIKRLINQIPEYKQMPLDFMYQPILMANKLKKPEKASFFSSEEQEEFIKKYEESNRRVAEEFLGRRDGKLFAEPFEKLPQWEINADTMYQDIILFYGELAVEQQRQIDDLKHEVSRLEWEMHNPFVHIVMLTKKVIIKICEKFQRK